MPRVQIDITGVERVQRAIGKASTRLAPKVADGLRQCAEVILRKSRQYVPVDTGELKKSGRVETTGQGLGAESKVLYGGPDAPYALYVHEDLTKFHAPPTQAKFLERAARETRGTCAAIMRRAVESRTRLTRNDEDVT
jgi:hypothetical protein